MTRHTRSISILADSRRHSTAVAVVLAALALFGAVATAGTATAQSDRPIIVVTDGTTAADGSTTVGVVLTNAPDGLAGYYLELTVENPKIARIRSASYPDRFGLTSQPRIASDGSAVTLEAADVEGAIEPGATDVTLAMITVAGASPGEVELALEPRQFDADDGSAFSPATQPGTVTVTGSDAASTTTANGATPDATSASTTGEGDETSPSRGPDPTRTATETTSGSGPLSMAVPLLAIVLLAVIGVRRDGV
ncbi:MAG: hypothetical protein ABEI80_07700 [Haloplanus sp.]